MKITLYFTLSLLFINVVHLSFSKMKDTTFYREKAEFIKLEEDQYQSVSDAIIYTDNRYVVYENDHRKITRHKIVHILTKEGLDDNNKVIIYVPKEGEIINLKARSISSNGQIVELNQSNIKEVEDYSERGDLKIFAIEGAQVKGQIEYTYTVKTPLYSTGKELLSMDYYTKHAYVVIKSTFQIYIDSKVFNYESLNKKHNHSHKHTYEFNEILPIAEEKYSTPKANRVYVEHKIKRARTFESVYSAYSNVVKKEYELATDYNRNNERKANRILRKFEKEFGSSSNELETLRKLTAFLKKRFYYENNYKEEFSDIKYVLKNNVGNDLGLIKLYVLILDRLEVEYEILMTSNKYDNRIDKEFPSRYALSEYILYFPQYDSYLYPSSQVSHFGLIPSWIAGNQALLIDDLEETDVTFKHIKSVHPDSNQTNLNIDVELSVNNGVSIFNIDGFGTGQIAFDYNYDMFYAESDEEKQEELESYVSWRYPDAEIMFVKMNNPEVWGDISACKSYSCERSYRAKVKSNAFMEKVGDKLLLNVGSLLGPQSELYSETERVQPITNAHNKSYRYTIHIPIPSGYEYSGEQHAVIDNVFENDEGEKIAGFKSNVNVNNNTIEIDIYEYYGQVNIDKKYYEDFRKIINSAADFNKATILLTKK